MRTAGLAWQGLLGWGCGCWLLMRLRTAAAALPPRQQATLRHLPAPCPCVLRLPPCYTCVPVARTQP